MMWKLLDPSGCTYHNGEAFVYNLPGRDEEWARTEHPKPAKPDGAACGLGRLHLMKNLDARYAPLPWWPWEARGIGTCIGEDKNKAAFASVELRRITKDDFWRRIREGECSEANLREADLRAADLREANLRAADLRAADLYGARWNSSTIWPNGFSPPNTGLDNDQER